jgi:ketosteroid isomerase-like protein
VGADAVRVVEAATSGMATGDPEAVVPHIHPDFEMRTPPGLAAEPDLYRGADGVRRWFESFYEVMDEVRVEASELEQVGDDVVVANLRVSARGRATGLELDQAAVGLARVADGKVKELQFFTERDQALAAARGAG